MRPRLRIVSVTSRRETSRSMSKKTENFEFVFGGYYSRYARPKMMNRSIFNFFSSLKQVLVYINQGGFDKTAFYYVRRIYRNTSSRSSRGPFKPRTRTS